ncbi:hypothetical protein RIF29_27736 [Crotalaria pallida]|uniref:CCT domain-containing protein n=1 Tax=Crotalaria pallida TaxID=3830 RepID=A0AAN9EQA8_CROPI
MYAHSNSAFSRASTTTPPPPPMLPDHLLTLSEFDSLWQLNNSEISCSYNNNNSNNNSCSSGCYNSSSYGSGSGSGAGSPCSGGGVMQRSVSSHSLQQQNNNGSGTHHSFSAIFAELLDSDDGPVRRVYSAGDLQRIKGMQHNHHSESPLSSECSIIIEGMNRACPYSPEEKKVRIERYRSKRNQRNFNKKIKYACRKTLADSRPRIRGRFARNEEIDKNPSVQWSQIGAGEEEEDEDENWVSVFESFVAANLAQGSQSSSSFGLLY